MARKSRKAIIDSSLSVQREEESISCNGVKERIPTAVYVRLSNENNGRDDEESLNNQISFVHSYIMEHSDEYELIDTYVDNGHTGTNFERPDFARMMNDVNHGKIGCIVVKDLSRFGRNYIETGIYIENILPKLNVKLIAINDNFDSSRDADRQSISIPVKNMVNELYSKDISRKMFTANKIRRMKSGVLPLGPDPYGYRKNAEGSRFIPNENADYVRLIFQWSVMEVSLYEIADRLNLIGAPLPKLRFRTAVGTEKWTASAVKKVIANPVYAGDVCMGRTRRTQVGSQRNVIEVPKDQWVIYKNTHEALVPRADFDLIYKKKEQNQLLKKCQMEEAKRNMVGISADFNNMVFCAECHKRMITRMENHNEGNEHTHVKYVCTSNRKAMERACYNVVYNDFLKVLVMDQVSQHVRLLTDQAEHIKRIKESGGRKDIGLSIDKQIIAASVRVEEKKQKEAKTYEDYKDGIIAEDDFKLVHEKFVLARQKAESELKSLNAKKDAYIRVINNFLALMENCKSQPAEDGFDKQLVMEMVERINVYRDDRIEIVFKHQDVERIIQDALENR